MAKVKSLPVPLSATDEELDNAAKIGFALFNRRLGKSEPNWYMNLVPFGTLCFDKSEDGIVSRITGLPYHEGLAKLGCAGVNENRLRKIGLKCSPFEEPYLRDSWMLEIKSGGDTGKHAPHPGTDQTSHAG